MSRGSSSGMTTAAETGVALLSLEPETDVSRSPELHQEARSERRAAAAPMRVKLPLSPRTTISNYGAFKEEVLRRPARRGAGGTSAVETRGWRHNGMHADEIHASGRRRRGPSR